MKGLANIPILIAIALIIAITPLAVYQVNKNQNLQNRAAADLIKISQVPCSEVISAQAAYCQSNRPIINGKNIPCADFNSYISMYCGKMIPTSIPTTNLNSCLTGQIKCVDRIIYKCINRNWVYSTTCRNACTYNGLCK